MSTVALARHAMATRFEIVLHGAAETTLRAAGEEALREIERLEAELSLYRPTSAIAHLNQRAALHPVRVTPPLFQLLQHVQQLHHETGGAFDVTVGPLMKCWGFMQAGGMIPDPDSLARARSLVGMSLVHLNSENYTVRFERAGVMIDLGAVGKGYAIEQAVEILKDAGIEHALIHGGTSTVFGLGHQADGRPWTIAIESPADQAGQAPTLLAAVPLRGQALSVSAVWGKAFEANNRTYGHVLDPRTGSPGEHARMAVVVTESATDADALSTALLVEGAGGLSPLANRRPGLRGLVLSLAGCTTAGIELV